MEQKYGYPQSIGAIDGTHIPVTPPADGLADFICCKGYPSIVLQAVVDGNYMFRDVYANTPGSAHDASVYRRSPLYDGLHRRMPVRDKSIDGIDVPLHITADPAYPFSRAMMKGYTDRNLTTAQEDFNVYLSSTRLCVEIAFGKLKKRWRILNKRLNIDYREAPAVITTCCMLHNMLEKLRIPEPAEELENAFEKPEPVVATFVEDGDAARLRDIIANHLFNSQPIRRPFHLH